MGLGLRLDLTVSCVEICISLPNRAQIFLDHQCSALASGEYCVRVCVECSSVMTCIATYGINQTGGRNHLTQSSKGDSHAVFPGDGREHLGTGRVSVPSTFLSSRVQGMAAVLVCSHDVERLPRLLLYAQGPSFSDLWIMTGRQRRHPYQ